MVKKMNKVIVIGDLFLDHYIYYSDKNSLPSLETGIFPLISENEIYSPGAAGNIARNMSLLKNEVFLLSIIGNDGNGFELLEALKKINVNTSFLVNSEVRSTPVYTKFINNSTKKEDLPRYDRLPRETISEEDEKKLLENLRKLIEEIDFIIVEDQYEYENGGVITRGVKEFIDELEKKDKKIFIDSRKNISGYNYGVKKPNIIEYSEKFSDEEKGEFPSEILVQKHLVYENHKEYDRTIVTANADGCYFVNHELKRYFYENEEVVDVCGAGDVFISVYCSDKMNGFDDEKAVIDAMKGASLCIKQLGTGVVTKEMVGKKEKPRIQLIENKNIFIKNPNNPRKLSLIIFDFDGTISLLREGWQPIMSKLMFEKITGEKNISHKLSGKIKNEIKEFISETTGIQTILQMEGLIDLIKRYGFVKTENIKSVQEYKNEYTEILKTNVDKRKKENYRKYLVSGITEFISVLHEKNITLYMASGTDKKDVIDEAEFLNVKKYFGGNIFGALESYGDFSKKKLVKRLTEENINKFKNMIIIGDGPVEIKVGREYGIYTIGVASNEIKGEGWNVDKYYKLKESGADMLISDFSNYKYLLKKLFSQEEISCLKG
ncbi:MAG: hypothetical protein PWQ77_1809 [Kosmotogales bacterium]|nr:hypothetical protein [Kosmotogales bacterium]